MDGGRPGAPEVGILRPMELPPEAFTQGLRFSYQQARAFGITQHRLAVLVKQGLLYEPAFGVYAPTTDDVVDPVVRHANVVREAQLSARKGAWYAARRSSAFLMGIPLIGRQPPVAQLVRDGNQKGAHGQDRHARISPLPSSDTWEYQDVAMCRPARTVVDIARAEPFRNAVVAVDGALRRGLDPTDLHAVLARMKRWPGVVPARKAVQFADGRAESALESLSRVAAWVHARLAPEPQVEVYVRGKLIARLDLLVRECLLAIEPDGAIKFDGPLVLPSLLARQEAIRGAGIDVLRTGWDEVFKTPEAFGARLLARVAERGPRSLPRGVELRSTVVRPQPPLLDAPDADAA